MLHGVVRHRPAAHGDGALRGLVQPGDQGHQGGLGAAGAAQDAHGLAGADVDVHVPQDPLGGLGVVLEGDVVEIDAAVLYLGGDGSAAVIGVGDGPVVGDGGAFLQHLPDAAGTGHGPGHHHEDHGYHHQGNHDLGDVGEEGDELSGLQGPGKDHLAAEPHDGDDGAVDDQHHDGHIDDHHAEGPLGVVLQVQVALGELLPLVVLPDEGLHHPDAGQVLLDHQVQRVGPLLHGAEQGAGLGEDQRHGHRQQRQRHQKDIAELTADADGEKQGAHQHHRGPHQQPHTEHQRHLQVVDVVGQARHQRGGGKFLDIGKGVFLDVVILRRAETRAEAHARRGGAGGGSQAEGQGHHGHHHHQNALAQDVALVPGGDAHIHNVAHHQRDQQLKDRLRRTAPDAQGNPAGVRPHIFRHVA